MLLVSRVRFPEFARESKKGCLDYSLARKRDDMAVTIR